MNKEKLIRRRMQEAEKLIVRGSVNRAIQVYEHVLRLDPCHEEALLQQFKCLFSITPPEELLAKADQLVGSLPENAEAWMCRALAYTHAREPEPAIESYRRCISLAPDDYRAIHNLGSLLCQTGNDAEGLPLLESAVRIQSDYQIGHATLLMKYFEKDRFEDAIQAGEQAPDYLGQKPEFRRILGECYYATGAFAPAAGIFSDIIHHVYQLEETVCGF